MLNLGNLGEGEFFFVVEGEEQMERWRQGLERFSHSIPLLLLCQPHFHFFLCLWFGIEGGEETGDVVVVAIAVLAQVVGDAEEPCGYVAAF